MNKFFPKFVRIGKANVLPVLIVFTVSTLLGSEQEILRIELLDVEERSEPVLPPTMRTLFWSFGLTTGEAPNNGVEKLLECLDHEPLAVSKTSIVSIGVGELTSVAPQAM